MLLSQVPSYFKARREALKKAHPSSVFIFPSGSEVLRNPDVHFPFRQESSFFYLSGFEEPDSFLVLTPRASVLFVRKRDPETEIWEGERYGIEGARKVFGVEQAYEVSDFEKKLPELLSEGAGTGGLQQIFYRMGLNEAIDRKVLATLDSYRKSMGRSGKALPPLSDPKEVLGEMRIHKAPEEAETLRKACQITALAHKTAMQEVRPGMNEYEVEALIDYTFRKKGCQRVGYGSIVAGGRNATCLHYRLNNEILRDGTLLLIDAGGELDYYTADITRTFPVGRSFSKGQAALYDLTLKSQAEAIGMAKPGATLPAIHKHVSEVLTEGLLQLGLLKGNRDEIIQSNGHRRFFPHGTSHWLGMDVHDVGLYLKNGEPRKLEPGMCFTIEPGLYVQPTDKDAPAEYRDIGIRIEDDILITSQGCEVLTSGAPKERAEIEALRA